MIRRINKIQEVGCFHHTRPGSLTFKKITLIFGENCYGKSTITDIFRSLNNDEPEIIMDRRTIPVSENHQEVILSGNFPNQTGENTLSFSEGNWSSLLPDDISLLIFDTDFIYRNVFTGLTIERENQENITQFVLGETNVQIAEEIAQKKGEIRNNKSELTRINESAFADINDINSFVSMEVNRDSSQIQEKITELDSLRSSKKAILENLLEIKNRPILEEPPQTESLSGKVEELNHILTSSYEDLHDRTKEIILDHIENHTQQDEKTESWIRNGISHISDELCPFCGQEFSDYSIRLINAYQSLFDDAFEEYVDNLQGSLDEIEGSLNSFSFDGINSLISKNKLIISRYPELTDVEETNTQIQELLRISDEVLAAHEEWKATHSRILSEVYESISMKKETIHKSIDPLNLDDFIPLYASYLDIYDNYSEKVDKLNDEITSFQKSLDEEDLKLQIRTLSSYLENERRKLVRLKLNGFCNTHQELSNQIDNLEENLRTLEASLEEEQTDYLNQYFDTINEIFHSLGSRDFNITKQISRRGDMPTVLISARFRGQDITRNNISKVLSESDRRALAFSIFWAKLETLPEDELNNTIIIMDDPVTSFDEGRIDRTIRLTETKIMDIRQLIILSHYSKFFKQFLNRSQLAGQDIQLISLFQDQNGSHFEETTKGALLETRSQKAFRRIHEFINREHREDIQKDLRVFLEVEIKNRHWRSIIENNLQDMQFRELLSRLSELEVIKEDQYFQINQLRRTLNPDHHGWSTRSQEDKITIAEDVINVIYPVP